MKDYEIECEECDETTYIASYDKPTFCPMCGRRADAERAGYIGVEESNRILSEALNAEEVEE